MPVKHQELSELKLQPDLLLKKIDLWISGRGFENFQDKVASRKISKTVIDG